MRNLLLGGLLLFNASCATTAGNNDAVPAPRSSQEVPAQDNIDRMFSYWVGHYDDFKETSFTIQPDPTDADSSFDWSRTYPYARDSIINVLYGENTQRKAITMLNLYFDMRFQRDSIFRENNSLSRRYLALSRQRITSRPRVDTVRVNRYIRRTDTVRVPHYITRIDTIYTNSPTIQNHGLPDRQLGFRRGNQYYILNGDMVCTNRPRRTCYSIAELLGR